MISTEKLIFAIIVPFHIFWLIASFLFGEGILFGIRVVGDLLRIFVCIELVLTITSIVFIYKNNKIGYVLFTISLISTYVIEFGHRMGYWPCPYCEL